ncbi:hypothetical protein [Streptomyces sp. Qhu_M48]|uniref:hypothetical protein n=1 Tax=Streptomyces sp. Qhu_M48 TaxID=3435889 RepID=UPI003F4FAA9B
MKLLPGIVAQMRAHARAAHIDQPLPEARAQQAALQVTALLPHLRELPELLLALGNREA